MDLRALFFTAIAAFAIALLLGPISIPILHRLKFGQSIREEGPQHHKAKAGTPTMGGVIILLAVILTTLKFAFDSLDTLMLLLATVGFGLIGFADDFIKIIKKRNLGLTAKQKLLFQGIVTILLFILLWYRQGADHSFGVHIPFSNWVVPLGIFYVLFLLIVLVGTTNAVNLTDGLDGLLSGCAIMVFAAYAFYAYWHTNYDAALFCAAMVGALGGFLAFNRHPAKVFMGDTGSLAIGGGLAMVAVLTHSELALILFGLVFVVEALSVMIQVFSYKTFGRRVFKMSPLHHHFELVGWSEWEVVLVFWLAAFICAFGTLALVSR
ncbi:phospho-N-acetylmuramoyl-pentapeptide-transferase [Alicyclobacillus acidoterrestris]|uniref:Phospho-N-acetylmuramoyl-pentapeptide-transferase n=1 Tax=Alicyclobacillus acidoterrestris (strain ATCC 49025 / DSM 3922 / CIP 106132 / NCIMB 13137 / GD3B) TaxID=1356854 RepID=T0BTW7_ALIAG|nr:phospho-N-acetylmuramoyl-pentapeptide-transferase [Alicyclobacillus acidoterrestris]EPZ43905.1 phospho-N-acetylmuramoyl-pentapeptide-transferase [Alicyclobacillus acidoterrestris ATCC 49025]UNO50575.1 phospho-N-acetylmuramoyl-pentapeptide-transferase [Alicyclobacillus acidoterrestris]